MVNRVLPTATFRRQAKRFVKKYRSLKSEIAILIQNLHREPQKGTPLGSDAYKIRLAVKSKQRGKSGGMRVITYVEAIVVEDQTSNDVYLLTIFDKSETASISDSEIQEMIKAIQEANSEGDKE